MPEHKMNRGDSFQTAFSLPANSPVTKSTQSKQADDFITINTPSGRIRKITKQQVKDLNNQPNIRFSETSIKNLVAEKIEVAIPAELGGGYVIGTSSALSSALHSAGITGGLAPQIIIRALLEIFAMSNIKITLTGIIVLLLDKFSR